MLPDSDVTALVVDRLTERACHMLHHASGRAWLLGCWSGNDVTAATAGPARVVVVGACSLDSVALGRRLDSMPDVGADPATVEAAVEAVCAGAAGSFALHASLDGMVYARGSVSQTHRLYSASVGGVTVVADRARTLAWLSNAALDDQQLAVRMAYPHLPHPVASAALWRGVRSLPADQAALLDHRGELRTTRWWTAPGDGLPVRHGAPALRDALRAAVAVRVTPDQVLGADLSGGLDSTSLCYLAADLGARLVTATVQWAAPGNEDRAYADRAALDLAGIERLVFGPGELPGHFTGIDQTRDPADEPSAVQRDRAQQARIADAMRAAGARQRLSGLGGDHVLQAPPQYLHALVRHRPVHGLRRAAHYRARHRWSVRATARTLFDIRPYRAWLNHNAEHLHHPDAQDLQPGGWGTPIALPAWASKDAHDRCAALLRTMAEHTEPLTRDRGHHAWLHQAQTAGRISGHITHDSTATGVPITSPYCDDAVLTACLNVSGPATASPWSYKPLLVAAMQGLVPQHILNRTSKDHAGLEWYAGLREHRAELHAWAQDSHLVAQGLANQPALRQALLSPDTLQQGAAALEATLGTEAWLRDLAAYPTPAYLAEHTHEPATRH